MEKKERDISVQKINIRIELLKETFFNLKNIIASMAKQATMKMTSNK